MSDNLNIAIIGAGLIAREYVKVVLALGHSATVVGRGQKKIDEVKTQFPDVQTVAGGLENWLSEGHVSTHAIIATPIVHLAAATKALLNSGCKSILVEKPLTYSVKEAEEIVELARSKFAEVFIAFNRRSYVSVREAARLIEQDGGVSSFHFDFTEATFRISPANYDRSTNKYWGIANSSHVIDTAFFLGGQPAWLETRQYGNATDWHPAGSIFTGLGETTERIPFTYHANWGCPGKWNIEIMTQERKLFFSPMEKLHQQQKGGFKLELVDLDYSLDVKFKAGFYKQTETWINQEESNITKLRDLKSELLLMGRLFNYKLDL